MTEMPSNLLKTERKSPISVPGNKQLAKQAREATDGIAGAMPYMSLPNMNGDLDTTNGGTKSTTTNNP
jgi:hypothetical protein